ncbi:MAG: hypothetical protein WBW33_30015, partial [Bryobacteraceae bacterium]
ALESALFEPDVHRIHETMQQQIRSLKSNIVGLSELSFDTSKRVADHIAGLERIVKTQEDGGIPQGLVVDLPGSDETEEAVLQDYMDRYELFCVLSATIGGLENIESQLGVAALKHIHAEFAKRVERALGGMKAKQLWGKGKVLVILNQAAEQASQRQARLRINLTDPFRLTCSVGASEFRLPFQVGLTEYTRGESVEELMRRVEEATQEQQLVAI